MEKERLTRVGTLGLELTREEVIELANKVRALERKCVCRYVDVEIADMLAHVSMELDEIDDKISRGLEALSEYV